MNINGKEMIFQEKITIYQLLENLGISEDKVVVEVNLEIIGKNLFRERILNQEDKVEIVSFVGGG